MNGIVSSLMVVRGRVNADERGSDVNSVCG